MKLSMQPDKTFAILMGMTKFDGFPPIPLVKNNLDAMGALLLDASVLGLAADHIKRVEDVSSASAKRLLTQYTQEAKSRGIKTLLFYYAGHGYRRTDSKYFLTAKDSDTHLINLDGTTAISYDDAIRKILKDAHIPQNIIILDACSSGTAALSDGTAFPDLELKGSYTLTSSADGKDSYFDADQEQHTWFTAELLRLLQSGIPNEKENLTLAELYEHLQKAMRSKKLNMSPQQKVSQEIQPHLYAFAKNRAFDPEKNKVREFEKDIQDGLADLEAGHFNKAKRIFQAIKAEIASELSREPDKAQLLGKTERYLAFCENDSFARPIYEKILGRQHSEALSRAKVSLEIQTQEIARLKASLEKKEKQINDLEAAKAAAAAQHQSRIQTLEEELLAARIEISSLSELLENLNKAQEKVKPQDGLIFIPGGEFEMGDVMGDKLYDDESLHRVSLSDYYLGQYAVSFEEYDRYCEATKQAKPDDAGWGRGRRPIINVSWYDAVAYCNWLSEQHGYKPVYRIDKSQKDSKNTDDSDAIKWIVSPDWDANGFRLPTEAEWEYAARALVSKDGTVLGGGKVRFGNGRDIADPKAINFDGRVESKKDFPHSEVGLYRKQTVPVGSLECPNALGLHDMSGNVWEWCWDWYGTYENFFQWNPRGADSGSYRVRRGGSWNGYPAVVRCAYRFNRTPGFRSFNLGFRLARAG